MNNEKKNIFIFDLQSKQIRRCASAAAFGFMSGIFQFLMVLWLLYVAVSWVVYWVGSVPSMLP